MEEKEARNPHFQLPPSSVFKLFVRIIRAVKKWQKDIFSLSLSRQLQQKVGFFLFKNERRKFKIVWLNFCSIGEELMTQSYFLIISFLLFHLHLFRLTLFAITLLPSSIFPSLLFIFIFILYLFRLLSFVLSLCSLS